MAVSGDGGACALVTVRAQESRAMVNWHDETGAPMVATIVLTSDQRAYIPFTFLCRALGLRAIQDARQRALDHAVLSRLLRQFPVDSGAGGRQLTWCLERRGVGFWLGGINANKVAPDVRERILEFQEQLVDLADRLLHGEVEATPAQALAEIHRIKGEQADALAWVLSLERRIGSLERVVLRPDTATVDGDADGA